jgi:hypothetical protein
MVQKETLSYYVNNHSPVFSTFLDVSKAFDRTNYCKLFGLLSKRDIPVYIIGVLINLYSNYLLFLGSCYDQLFHGTERGETGGCAQPRIILCLRR